jgi:hypothetical protein
MLPRRLAPVCVAVFLASIAVAAGGDGHQKPLTIEAFAKLPDDLTFPQLVHRVGEPDDDIGSGLFIYRYHLADGSFVVVSTGDRQRIGTITHIVGAEGTQLWPHRK